MRPLCLKSYTVKNPANIFVGDGLNYMEFFTITLEEILISIGLFIYVMFITSILTKKLYEKYRDRVGDIRMRYYNRKVIHIFAGGVVAILVPYIYKSPLIPLLMGIALAILVLIPYLKRQILYWFQVEENMYDVNFCIVWGLTFLLSYLIWGDLIHGMVIISFMAFGDAVTGIVRNYFFKRRTKHWLGNIAMFLVSAPIAYYFLGVRGLLSALAASVAEHFEYGPVDDNVLAPLAAFITLLIL